jgi:hypothetical protein
MSEFFSLCNPFFWGAVIFAVFFGLRSVFIFVRKEIYYDEIKTQKLGKLKEGKNGQGKMLDWWIYQVWFNASGAFIGWAVLYFLSKANHHHLKRIRVSFLAVPTEQASL